MSSIAWPFSTSNRAQSKWTAPGNTHCIHVGSDAGAGPEYALQVLLERPLLAGPPKLAPKSKFAAKPSPEKDTGVGGNTESEHPVHHSKPLAAGSFPPIGAVQDGGQIIAIQGNRRLFIHRVLSTVGVLESRIGS